MSRKSSRSFAGWSLEEIPHASGFPRVVIPERSNYALPMFCRSIVVLTLGILVHVSAYGNSPFAGSHNGCENIRLQPGAINGNIDCFFKRSMRSTSDLYSLLSHGSAGLSNSNGACRMRRMSGSSPRFTTNSECRSAASAKDHIRLRVMECVAAF